MSRSWNEQLSREASSVSLSQYLSLHLLIRSSAHTLKALIETYLAQGPKPIPSLQIESQQNGQRGG